MNLPGVEPALITAIAAFLTATGISLKQVFEWYRQRAEDSEMEGAVPAKIDSVIAQSADAAVVLLSKTIDALQDENARLVHRVSELEVALSGRDRRIEELEARLRRAEQELRAVADELAILKNHP